jgi:AcrR family transcriptional regulator
VVRPRTRLDPEERRDQIIDAAELAFQGRDPGEVTFEQVADKAGVSRALVYNYFGDKGGLLAAVYLRSVDRLDARLADAFARNRPGPEQVRAIISCYLDFAESDTHAWALISAAEANAHPLIRQARRDRYERMAHGWGQTAPARLLARAVIGLLEGAILDWLDTPNNERDRDEEEKVLFTLLWSGFSGLVAHDIDLPRPPT